MTPIAPDSTVTAYVKSAAKTRRQMGQSANATPEATTPGIFAAGSAVWKNASESPRASANAESVACHAFNLITASETTSQAIGSADSTSTKLS